MSDNNGHAYTWAASTPRDKKSHWKVGVAPLFSPAPSNTERICFLIMMMMITAFGATNAPAVNNKYIQIG